MVLKEKSLRIFNFVRDFKTQNPDKHITHTDIAEALGLTPNSVTGTLTDLGKKDLIERVPAVINVQKDDKTVQKPVKFIELTEKGKTFDPEAEAEEE